MEVAERLRHPVEEVPEFPASLPGWVALRLHDGRGFEQREPINRGHPDNPMAPAEVQAKFRDNASRTLPAARVEAIIRMVESPEELPRIGDLTALRANRAIPSRAGVRLEHCADRCTPPVPG